MQYETWFHGNLHLIAADPALPMDSGDYTNLQFVIDGPPVAHAVPTGTTHPECGTDARLLPHGYLWPQSIPDWWQRCPKCLALHPL